MPKEFTMELDDWKPSQRPELNKLTQMVQGGLDVKGKHGGNEEERQSSSPARKAPRPDDWKPSQRPELTKHTQNQCEHARDTPIEEHARRLAQRGVPLLAKKLVKQMVGLHPQHLGRGMLGWCCKGVDPRTGKAVVVKTFKGNALDSLVTETVCLKQLQGSGVQRLVGVCVQTRQLVTRFAGQTAQIYFRFQTPLPQALSVILQVARALRGVHQAGFAHNDIKSNNVCVTETPRGPRATLIDLGMAEPLGTRDIYPAQKDLAALQRTYPWVAPELIRNSHPCSEASDVYSMAWLVLQVKEWQRRRVAGPAMWALWQWVQQARQPHPEQRPSLDALVQVVEELRVEVVPFLTVRRGRCPNRSPMAHGNSKGE